MRRAPSGEGSETSIQECCQLGNIFRDPWMGGSTDWGVWIDLSGDENLKIGPDDVSVSTVKAVRGLRKVARQHYTRDLISDKSHQGVVATGLSLEHKSKNMTRLVSFSLTKTPEEKHNYYEFPSLNSRIVD
ncbi:hypothetical protein OUZ56_003668 [Daphnia magna]|uniref:Uncharacterized protein n=1 Tax=Daphnia magna TaxID=35525 RepID=A0ABR0A9S4_9CRUS|nr:hypothetical protein OUZ56_003668 [Daphnia magna]